MSKLSKVVKNIKATKEKNSMNNLVKVEEDNIKRISSREVAEMLEVLHKNLMKKIGDISVVLTGSKVSPLDYWIESSYKDGKGEYRKEYLISKKGCEFLAHKSTGDKGILFTVKYMERFELMEEKLKKTTQPVLPQTYIQALEALVKSEKEKEEMLPKVDYHDKVLDTVSEITTTVIAKELGMSAIALNKKLHELEVQYRQNGRWYLYSKYQDKGYTKIRTTVYAENEVEHKTKHTMVWTEKGRKFIHSLITGDKRWAS